MSIKLKFLLAAVAPMMLIAAACGGEGDAETTTDGPEPAPVTAAQPAPSPEPATDSEPAPSPEPATDSDPISTPEPAPEPSADHRWIMVTDQAGLGDQGFNDLAWDGVSQAASDFGGEADVIESSEQAQYVPNLQQAVDAGASLTVGVGFLITDAIEEVAEASPDANFVLIDAVADNARGFDPGEPLSNVQSVLFKEHEAAYLAGIIAGHTTVANKMGFVGGIEIPPVVRFLSGFRQGVASVNPEAEISVAWVGSFDDPTKGKELTAAAYDEGADVVFEVAGLSGLGTYEEASDRGAGHWAIGTDTCKDQLAPDNFLTSATKDVAGSVYRAAAQVADGTFNGGVVSLGLDGAFVGVCQKTFGDLSQEIQDDVIAATEGIKSGDIVVDPGV